MKNFISKTLIFCITASLINICAESTCAKSDYRSREIKYQYNVFKQDLIKEREGKIYNRYPTGYMTVEEYEKASEYKDKTDKDFVVPKPDLPSDFKYIPKPLYRIVKYNDPPGAPDLRLGRQIYKRNQINAQGIVSPDYSIIVYPAVYYYPDSASTGTDLFVIPLKQDSSISNLERILKANTSNRITTPILSTDKDINNFAAFRTLTPVDFSTDGSMLLIKEKIGSSEDGIWETRVYVYDFTKKMSYDLNDIREAVMYFWREYMHVNLEAYRWDIMPLGFSKDTPSMIVVQAYAYTGEKPIYLGAWGINTDGNQSQLISFKHNDIPSVSSNGLKVVQDGVQDYTITKMEEKFEKQQSKVVKKNFKSQDKQLVNEIKDEYKYKLKELKDDYKDEYRDNKKLNSLKGANFDNQLEEAFKKYQQEQLQKDIQKAQKSIDKEQKKLDKIEEELQKLTPSDSNNPETNESLNTNEEE